MAIEYMGLNNIQGPLAVIEGVDDTFYEEMVTVTLDNGEKRIGIMLLQQQILPYRVLWKNTFNSSMKNMPEKKEVE